MTATEGNPVPQRLLNGAKVLGRLWRSGKRCEQLWSMDCHCEPKPEFCTAKLKWVELYLSTGREVDFGGDFGIIESMTPEEFEATGLTMSVEFPEIGTIKIGPKGQIPWAEVWKEGGSMNGFSGLAAVSRVLQGFPGAKVIA